MLYLDQSAWVRLARAASGKEPSFVVVLDALRAAKADGSLHIALGSLNYLELWHRAAASSRSDLAAVMAELTGYVSLAPVHRLAAADLSRSLGLTREVPSALGIGVDHAFSSPLGRLRIVERIASEDDDEGAELAPSDDLLAVRARVDPQHWEWWNLAGFSGAFDFDGIDLRPEHRLGDGFAEWQEMLRRRAADESGPTTLYRALVAQTFEAVADHTSDRGTQELSNGRRSIPEMIGVLNGTPSLAVFTVLLFLAHRNGTYRFRQHDRADVLALAQAVPVCDAVWADKHWASLARAAHLDDHYGTAVVHSAAGLLTWLDHRVVSP
ncbi:hypothetical protein DEJ01_09915 [Curtobacterium sp. MCLR17_040]|nr:hypothetical protein DEJ01_09915 [Curtobacterium sp. MCLR17_040]